MPATVLLGHPKYFRILQGANPHTRDRWGRRKIVVPERAIEQWERFRHALEELGVRVLVLPPSMPHPGSVFPANAGLMVEGVVYLSRPNPARVGERELYRPFLEQHGYRVAELPGPPHQWEGEADTFFLGVQSGDAARTCYLFTAGPLERQRWVGQWGWPPYRRLYGFRTDEAVLPVIRQIVAPREGIPVELIDERYYHGDTCLCAFGPHREHLLAYLPALSPASRQQLTARFGERLIPLDAADAEAFTANAYQVDTTPRPTLVITHRASAQLQEAIRRRGVEVRLVNVDEFMTKGGGSVKCLLLHLDAR